MSSLKVLDTVIQTLVVDLFEHYGVSVAPLPRPPLENSQNLPEHCAMIAFSSKAMSGTLVLGVPTGVFGLMHSEVVAAGVPRDHIRELTNQLLGRLKSRMLQLGVTLDAGLPASHNPNHLRARLKPSQELRTFEFRTLRGTIVVLVEGKIDESQLRYVGRGEHGSEGDVILF